MMKTLVLIPAFGCDHRLYAPQIAALKEQCRVLTIVVTTDSMEGMVEEVLQQAPKSFAILGTSLGGRVALQVALSAPQRVEGLCIIGAGAGGVADQVAGLRRSARIRGGERADVIAEMAEKISHRAGPRGLAAAQAFADMGNAIDTNILAQQSDALAGRVDLWDELDEVECLTLCLWGEHDQFSPAEDGQRIAQSVLEGDYVEFPACGHFPTLEYPEETTEMIIRWLEDIDDVGEVED
jgi:pimeloyl-ACP methyl ester carboxylesterase